MAVTVTTATTTTEALPPEEPELSVRLLFASLPLLITRLFFTSGPLFPGDCPFADWDVDLEAHLCPTWATTTSCSETPHLADALALAPQSPLQVCSLSMPSNSSKNQRFRLLVECVALDLWDIMVALWVSKDLDAFVSTFVPSCSTSIAVMRSFTAKCGSVTVICEFCLDLAVLKAVIWMLGQRASSIDIRPVNLVHWGSYSPHLSFMELIFLRNTSLVFSGSVTWSIVFKTVLLQVEARSVAQDCSRSAFADCLSLVSLEASVAPYMNESSSLVELVCSDLSFHLWFELVSSHLSFYQCLAVAYVVTLPFAVWFILAGNRKNFF